MADRARPLSPHLTAYRLPLTALTSISHRATGIALGVGTLLLVYWLMSAAAGPDAYAAAQGVIGSLLGRVALFAWTAALFYHLLNGIRHLVWDAGYGLDLETAETTGWVVVIGTAVLTILTWILGYVVMA